MKGRHVYVLVVDENRNLITAFAAHSAQLSVEHPLVRGGNTPVLGALDALPTDDTPLMLYAEAPCDALRHVRPGHPLYEQAVAVSRALDADEG